MAEEEKVDNRPNSQKDLELRLAGGHRPSEIAKLADERDRTGAPVSFAVEGNDTSGYVGVSPEYMTYANETEAPLQGAEGIEAEAGYRLTQPLRQVTTEASRESKQITGVGSKDPVLYAEVSGDIYKTEQVTVTEGKEPTTVEEEGKLDAKLAKTDGAVVTPAAKPAGAPDGTSAPQGASSGDKASSTNKNKG